MSGMQQTGTRQHSALVRDELAHEALVLDAPAPSSWEGSPVAPGHRWARLGDGLSSATIVVVGLTTVWWPVAVRVLDPEVGWAIRGTALVLVALLLIGRVRRRGSGPVLTLVGLFAVFALTRPWWTAWSPRQGAHETAWLAAPALAATAVAVSSAGRGSGVGAIRRMWVAILLTLVPVGAWEVASHRHLALGTWAPPAWSPAATFNNPNDFAVLLTAGVGLAAGAATERQPVWRRVSWLLLCGACLGLVLFTVSRLSLVACGLMLILAAQLWARRAGRGPSLRRASADGPTTRSRRLLAGAAAAVLVGVVVLAGRRQLVPGDAATHRADRLRVTLIETGLQFWSEAPWTGIGAGRFEYLLRDRRPDLGVMTPMHNGLAEILVEFGLPAALALGVVLVLVLLRCRMPRDVVVPTTSSGLDEMGARHLVRVYVLAFALGGVLMSSSLPVGMWWLLLGAAVGTAWSVADLGRTTHSRAGRGEDDPPHGVVEHRADGETEQREHHEVAQDLGAGDREFSSPAGQPPSTDEESEEQESEGDEHDEPVLGQQLEKRVVQVGVDGDA